MNGSQFKINQNNGTRNRNRGKMKKMTVHEQAAQKAIAALPNENPAEVSAVINPDGTVDTYTRLSAPEWLHPNSRILRDKVAAALRGLPISE